MNSRSKRIADQLGMSQGAAVHRLRKILLFKYVSDAGDNYCYKCGGEISIDDFSIEHKEPWENRDTEKFWDIENIAFSHLKCNRPHEMKTKNWGGPGSYAGKKKCPSGSSWCSYCSQCISVDLFGKNKNENGRDGLQRECSPCRSMKRRVSRVSG